MDTNLRSQIKNLSVSERILLAEEIWDSVAEENKSFVLSSSQKEELERRLELFNQNPNAGRNWEEIRSEFLGK
ncbi:MAG: addiction module protein [Ignavibacteriales bacterium]|nr:addiction module protein [Ignavibacteriales bacterium]